MTDVLEDRGLETAEARFRAAKAASTALATATTVQKNRGLEAIADALLARTAEIIAANADDLEAGQDERALGGPDRPPHARRAPGRRARRRGARDRAPARPGRRRRPRQHPARTASTSRRCACPSASSARSTRRARTSPSTSPRSR